MQHLGSSQVDKCGAGLSGCGGIPDSTPPPFESSLMGCGISLPQMGLLLIDFFLVMLSLSAAAYISTTVVGEIWVALHIVDGMMIGA